MKRCHWTNMLSGAAFSIGFPRLDQSIPIRRAFSAGRHQRRAKERSFPPPGKA
ncbi:MAG: hypothetical protein ACLSHC_16235 [Bilophila wadsworthia]